MPTEQIRANSRPARAARTGARAQHPMGATSSSRQPVRADRTSGASMQTAVIPRDGRWLYYTNYAVSPSALERIAFEGGTPVKLSSQYDSSEPVVSPDGKLIAYEHYDDRRGWHTALLPAEGGEPVKVFDFHAFRAGVRWTIDGQAVLYA